jgi:hypothetical protein
MRNKDGVLGVLDCLSDPLYFKLGVEDALKIYTDSKYAGTAVKSKDYVQHINNVLTETGYTGYEYLGFFAFFTNCNEACLTQLSRLAGRDCMQQFFDFKFGRLSDLTIRMQLLEEYYADRILGGFAPIEALAGVAGDSVRKVELMLRQYSDFSTEDVNNYFIPRATDVRRRLGVSPELLVVCPHVTKMLKAQGGDNEYVRLICASH